MATTDKQAPAERLPQEGVEDAAEVTTARAEDSLDVGGDEGQSEAAARPAGPKIDPRRQAAIEEYHRIRAQREAADRGETTDEDTADDAAGEQEQAPAAAAPATAPAAPAAQPAAQAQDEPTYTLIVDGKPVTMKASEVIAKAQIAVASDNRLDEAKRLLAEAKAIRSQASNPEHQPGQDDGETGHHEQQTRTERPQANQPRAIDKEKLKAIVSRIQVGDDEEGAEAAAELAAEIAASMAQPDVAKVVDETLVRRNIQSEIQTASQAFQNTYPGIIQDQELLEVSFAKLRAKVREDLVAAGEDPNALAPLNGEQLFALHQQRRMQGVKVRDYNRIFGEVGQEMAAKFAPVLQPAPAKTAPKSQPTAPARSDAMSERIDRKRSATPQPRAAGVRTQTQPSYQPKTREQIVAETRRARGFHG